MPGLLPGPGASCPVPGRWRSPAHVPTLRLRWPWALSDRWDERHRPHGLLAVRGALVSERAPAQACACGQAARVPRGPRASVASQPLPAVAARWPCRVLRLGVSLLFSLVWRCPRTSVCLQVRRGAASRRVLPFSVPSVHVLVSLLALSARELFPGLSAGTPTASDGASVPHSGQGARITYLPW